MQSQRTLQVGCLVLVNYVVLRQLVEHRRHLRQQNLGSALLGGVAQSLHGVTRGLVIQTVVCALGDGLANSFLRLLVICHNFFLTFIFTFYFVCFQWESATAPNASVSFTFPIPRSRASPNAPWDVEITVHLSNVRWRHKS